MAEKLGLTDTDKLKQLADELKDVASGKNEHGYLFVSRSEAEAVLALIAENERLKVRLNTDSKALKSTRRIAINAAKSLSSTTRQRDEAVSLLRECLASPMEPWDKVSLFLDKLDDE